MICTYNADEAIEVLETRTGLFAIFTDIDMPGSMDGLKLAAEVRGCWPPIHVIITTGKNIGRGIPAAGTLGTCDRDRSGNLDSPEARGRR